MTGKLVFGACILLAPGVAGAATLSAVAEARVSTADISAGEYLTEVVDTADGATAQGITADVSELAGDAFAHVSSAPSEFTFRLSSAARAPGAETDATVYARARFGITSEYRAVGSGVFNVDLAVSAAFSVMTDRDDGVLLAHVFAGFEITTPDDVFARRVSNTDPFSPLAGLFSGAHTGVVSGSVSVEDGDPIILRLFGVADTGEYPQSGSERDNNASFFSATSRLFGGASLRAEGFDLVPVPDLPAPVPLPAGFPLLIAGLAGLAAARMRRLAARETI